MKLVLHEPKRSDKTTRYSSDIIIKDKVNTLIYFDIPNDQSSKEMHKAQQDSFFLLGSIFSSKLGISLHYRYEVSSVLMHNMDTIHRMIGTQEHILKSIYHKTKSKMQGGEAQERKNIDELEKYPAYNEAQFFTLGLDSFHTLLCKPQKPQYLLYVEGYDIKLSQQQLINKVKVEIQNVAKSTGTTPLFVRTNIREIAEMIISWEQFHGAACSMAAYYFYSLFNTIYTNDTKGVDREAIYWGSSPNLDPLFSTEYMKIESFGHDKNRYDKALELSKHQNFDLVLNSVRACWKNDDKGPTEFNCCRCEKCARTYYALVAATGKTMIPAFKNFSLATIDTISYKHHSEIQPCWKAIHKNLEIRFGANSEIAKKTLRFTY